MMDIKLPQLRGHLDLVALAEQARAERVAEMERYADALVGRYRKRLTPAQRDDLQRRIMRGFAPILAQTRASYWLGLQPSRPPITATRVA